MSTFIGSVPLQKVQRWDFDHKKMIEINCPAIVAEYNKFMGHTDNIGHLLALYRIKIDCRRQFYLRIFFHLCDLMVINSWLSYRKDYEITNGVQTGQLDLWAFKASVAFSWSKNRAVKKVGRRSFSEIELENMWKRKRGPAKPLPSTEIRRDRIDHLPEFKKSKGRCRRPGCDGIVRVWCSTCCVFLCFTSKKKRFKDFHCL